MKRKCVVSVIAALLWLECVALTDIFGGVTRAFAQSASFDSAPPADSEPPVLVSSNHVLDLLVIAESAKIALGDRNPIAWVFEICPRAVAPDDNCPAGSQTFAPYGGIRLQLFAGDHLRMRLINRLPPVPADSIYAHGNNAMMSEMLRANPVNIHTHGLVVEPRKANAKDPSYGDYVFVMEYPKGKLPPMVAPGDTATDKPIQYDIYIPPNHPSGIYWFHPHVHGLNINQLSEGLSGLITIGRVTDYVSAPNHAAIPERYFVLKDMQVMGDSQVVDQEDSAFCSPYDLAYVQRNGYCQGRNSSGGDGDFRLPAGRAFPGIHHLGSTGADYTGGLWFFTVNGAVYPQLPAPTGSGELWRLLNAGASRTYDLVLRDDQTKTPVPFQVVTLNGAALAPPAGTTAVGEGAAKDTVPSPGAALGATMQASPAPAEENPAQALSAPPVCATHLVLFPGARAEIWVAPQLHSSTLLTEMVSTGPAGDRWPQVNLAHIAAGHSDAVPVLLLVRASQAASTSPANDATLNHHGRSEDNLFPTTPTQTQRVVTPTQQQEPNSSATPSRCSALPKGHRRRIFFGVPATNKNGYGLGLEEVDENGQPVPGSFRDIAPFDPSAVGVCLPLGPGNRPVTEEWELVNVSGEAHNFHIHQARFYVLPQNAPEGDAGNLMDSVSLPNGGAACDGTVATWRSGRCKVATVIVRIPFSEPGDFIYHCHIGEHQDSGMMARIRVIPFKDH
ncbi:MAG TPA: multicopper oxidase domain-containing protein [Terracidiphilus sp.]|nr:multicopper oxidase domain-containing protein [Terracidiphilus sp.]